MLRSTWIHLYSSVLIYAIGIAVDMLEVNITNSVLIGENQTNGSLITLVEKYRRMWDSHHKEVPEGHSLA